MYHWFFTSFVLGVYTTALILFTISLIIIVVFWRVRMQLAVRTLTRHLTSFFFSSSVLSPDHSTAAHSGSGRRRRRPVRLQVRPGEVGAIPLRRCAA